MNNFDIHLVGCHFPAKLERVTPNFIESEETKKNIAELSDATNTPTQNIVEDIYYHSYVLVPDHSKKPKTYYSPDSLQNIILAFCNLDPYKKQDEFNRFISKYGLLGIWEPPPIDVSNYLDEIKYFNNSRYGTWFYEPIETWDKHIMLTRELYRIYSNLIKQKKYGNRYIQLEDKVQPPTQLKDGGSYYWLGNQLVFKGSSSDNPQKMAVERLAQCLQESLRGGINIDYTNFMEDPLSNIGYAFISTYSTPYLMAAIYFSLWKMINLQESAHTCDYCGKQITNVSKGRTKKFCNGTCRTNSWRQGKV